MGQRYQREIEEILDKVNEDQPTGPTARSASGSRRERAAQRIRAPREGSRFRLEFSPSKLLLGGIALLLVSFAMLLMGLTTFAAPIAWVGIAAFIGAYVLFFTKPRRTVERRWRGQSIEDVPDPGPLGRFWRWVSRG